MFTEARIADLYILLGHLVSRSASLHHILMPLLAWELPLNMVKTNDSLHLNHLA